MLQLVLIVCLIFASSGCLTLHIVTSSLLVLGSAFVCFVWVLWISSFSTKRARTDPACVSYKMPPGLTLGAHSARSASGDAQAASSCPHSMRAEELNMNHVYLGFFDLLWGYCFVTPNAIVLWVSGVLCLRLRCFLYRIGILHLMPRWMPGSFVPIEDYAHAAATMFLEFSLIMCFQEIKGPNDIAIFVWPQFAYLGNNGRKTVVDYLTIEIDLTKPAVVRAHLGSQALNAQDAYVLIWFAATIVQHPKIHAFSNWATNMNSPNAFIRRMSLVTILYNHFGQSSFPWIVQALHSCGLASFDSSKVSDVFEHTCKAGVEEHKAVRQIAKHSELAQFSLGLRGKFLAAYHRHQKDFVDIDGEALFVSMLHSLDHAQMERMLVDPLHLLCGSQFHVLEDLGMTIRAGFVSSLPGLLFAYRYKNAPHPFYQEVYRIAVALNPRLADEMEACIIR